MATTSFDILDEKWKMTFKLMDVAKDGVISAKDRDACKEKLAQFCTESGADKSRALSLMDEMWNKAVFLGGDVDWSKEFGPDEFVQYRADCYKKDKQATVQIGKEAVELLASAADVTGDGQFTFDKFFKLNQTFNITDEAFVKATFDVISSNGDTLQKSQIAEFYFEFILGEDPSFHEKVKALFQSSGLF